jgi:serine/threonine protein kinase
MDLETLVKLDGPQPPARVVHLLRQACHSLHEAHKAFFVHRDIKPANLFLCRYGADLDFLKVLDFGLVAQRRKDADPSKLTADNAITGTPAFMAPEVVMGDHPIDGRTDIYALGCVAYWLLTGALVFDAETGARRARSRPRSTASCSTASRRIPRGGRSRRASCPSGSPRSAWTPTGPSSTRRRGGRRSRRRRSRARRPGRPSTPSAELRARPARVLSGC